MDQSQRAAGATPKAGTDLFKGIEGARGWLACAVVATHFVVLTPLVYLPVFAALIPIARWAVEVFIIISGFVITHLLVSTEESYPLYILRRALRIYPAYLVALALGVLTAPLLAELLAAFPMQPPHEIHQGVVASRQIGDPIAQLLLHVSLMQGLRPETIHGYLPPAWSLSLEWQFYLLAPLFVAAARRRPAIVAAVAALCWLGYSMWMFGRFSNPSLILGGGWLFLAGILSRLHLDRLPSLRGYPAALPIALAPLAVFAVEAAAIVAWIALLAYVRSDRSWWLLDGRLARYVGARSYTIYILHYPIVLAAGWAAWRLFGLATKPAILAAFAATLLLLAAAVELVYRLVERPAIRLGKHLSREPVPGAQGW